MANELKTVPHKDTADYDRDAKRTIVAAAVLDTEADVVHTMDAPARHYNILHAMSEWGFDQGPHHEQGFLTSDGYFLRRKPALIVAEEAKQLIRRTAPSSGLFSEDVW